MKRTFDVGETVWYKGEKWLIADHLNGKYLLWKKAGGKEVNCWIPENQIAKV